MARFEYECEEKVICNNDTIFPAMKTLVEDEGMSIREASRFIKEDSDGKVTEGRARMVYQRRTTGTRVPPDKPKPSTESRDSKPEPSREPTVTERRMKKELDDFIKKISRSYI